LAKVVRAARKILAAASYAAVLGLAITSPASATLLTNGDFETGAFAPGWTFVGSLTSVVSGQFFGINGPESGTYYVAMGNPGCCGTISQTISDTPGDALVLTYWLAGDGSNPSYFDVLWNGTTINGSEETNFNSSGVFQQFTFDLVGTGTDTLMFRERDDPLYLGLDNISLDIRAATAVPEPGTLALLGVGLMGTFAGRRYARKPKKQA
jgi:hypothetical protein